jgi:hypothetical protein
MTNGNGFDPSKVSFSIIKHRGDPKSALTEDGIRVFKEDSVISDDPYDSNVPPRKIEVRCMDYHMEHFVYIDPVQKTGRWFAWCTCGSPAVIVGMEDPLLVCFFYTKFGRHVVAEDQQNDPSMGE